MTHDPTLTGFIAGAITAGFVVVSLFCFKFWRRTRDGLFLAFALAFVILAFGQVAQVLANTQSEYVSGVYLLRLVAFLLIIGAVLRKNLAR